MAPKTKLTVAEVESKCKLMQSTHTPITYRSVALCLGVSRGVIANHAEYREVIERYQVPEQTGDRTKQLNARRTAFNEAIKAATEPGLKTWVDESIKGSWTPEIGKEFKAQKEQRTRVQRWERMY